MLKPNYKLTLGKETFEPGSQSPVLSLRANYNMEIPADSLEIWFGVSEQKHEYKENDPVQLDIGYDDKLSTVFKGTIDSINPNIRGVKIVALNEAIKLLKLRLNEIYLEQSAEDIVSAVGGKAGLSIDSSEKGITFPSYNMDDNKNAYEHLDYLANLSGVDFYLTNENKIFFKKYSDSTAIELEYGVNVLDVETHSNTPTVKNVTVMGEGASSFKGKDSVSWLTKKTVSGEEKGTFGKYEGGELLYQEPVLRDQESSANTAKAILSSLEMTLSGSIRIIGDEKNQARRYNRDQGNA